MALRWLIALMIVIQGVRVEAKDLGVCSGIDVRACAAALYHSDPSGWLDTCEEYFSHRPSKMTSERCIREIDSCLPKTDRDLKEKFQSQDAIEEELWWCFEAS